MHNFSDFRQTEVHTGGLSCLEVEIEQLKKYKLPGSDQILAKLIQAGGETLLSNSMELSTTREATRC
jgi:hypothetical protein